MAKEKKSLFPVYFEGKQYFKKDCDSVFLSFYTCEEALNGSGGVYMADGTWVYPDGSMKSDSDEF